MSLKKKKIPTQNKTKSPNSTTTPPIIFSKFMTHQFESNCYIHYYVHTHYNYIYVNILYTFVYYNIYTNTECSEELNMH